METRNRSRLEILNWIMNFAIKRFYGENYRPMVEKDQSFISVDEKNPPIGALVALGSAPFTKFYLSWLIDYKEEGYGGSWLLQSIEDGSLCWWTNVSLSQFAPEKVKENIHWKWNDAQWEFKDRWFRACKRRGAYITLPVFPVFHEDGSVTIGTRTRHSFDEHRPTKTFPNWKKVKVKDMLEFYDSVNKK